MRFSHNCRKHFDKYWFSETVLFGMAQNWLYDNQITVIKSPAECQGGGKGVGGGVGLFELGTFRF